MKAGIRFEQVIGGGKGFTTVLADNGETYTLKGDRNWRNNNPGNIEYGEFAKSHGAIGSDGRFAVFPDAETGHAAQEALQFDSPAYRDLSIEKAILRYAPQFENDSAAYAAQVAAAAGVPVTTKMSDLTAEQRARFLEAQRGVEGFKPGKILGADGQTVSPEVAKQFGAIALPGKDVGPSGPSVLRKGSKGDEVFGLQTLLDAAGFSPGTIDGDFGPKTEKALRAYQEANGLKVDGVAGPQTYNSFGQGASGAGREFEPLPSPAPLVPGQSSPSMQNSLMPRTAVASEVDIGPGNPGPGQVRLASGKMIAPGVYPGSDGHQVRISDDGHGGAKVERVRGPGAIPGVIDPVREMNAPTVAGGFIRRVTPAIVQQAVQQGADAVPQAANALTSGAQTKANEATKAIESAAPSLAPLASVLPGGNLLGPALGFAGNLFGKSTPPAAPASVSNPETRLLSLVASPRLGNDVGNGPSYTGLQTQRMLEAPTFEGPGRGPDWDTLQTVKDVMLYPQGNEMMPHPRPAAAPRPAAPPQAISNFAPSGRTRASIGETAQGVWNEAKYG